MVIGPVERILVTGVEHLCMFLVILSVLNSIEFLFFFSYRITTRRYPIHDRGDEFGFLLHTIKITVMYIRIIIMIIVCSIRIISRVVLHVFIPTLNNQ